MDMTVLDENSPEKSRKLKIKPNLKANFFQISKMKMFYWAWFCKWIICISWCKISCALRTVITFFLFQIINHFVLQIIVWLTLSLLCISICWFITFEYIEVIVNKPKKIFVIIIWNVKQRWCTHTNEGSPSKKNDTKTEKSTHPNCVNMEVAIKIRMRRRKKYRTPKRQARKPKQ